MKSKQHINFGNLWDKAQILTINVGKRLCYGHSFNRLQIFLAMSELFNPVLLKVSNCRLQFSSLFWARTPSFPSTLSQHWMYRHWENSNPPCPRTWTGCLTVLDYLISEETNTNMLAWQKGYHINLSRVEKSSVIKYINREKKALFEIQYTGWHKNPVRSCLIGL